jgi:SAM-dependent methyltransferase
VLTPGVASRIVAAIMRHFIDEFIFFRSFVFVRGWIERPARSLFHRGHQTTFTFHYQGSKHQPFVKWVKRPDVAAVFGADAAGWGFELHAMFPDAAEDEIYRVLELTIRSGDDEIVVDRSAEHSSLLDANQIWQRFLARPRQSMIEIGARARSGISRREIFGDCEYIGFDVLPGENVDVVGDAHFLSHYVNRRVDAVASLSTFEHLVMPWKVVEEINRVLNPDGVVITQAPQTWPIHDQPWDYFRFSKESWRGLFNEATGFRIVETADCGPCVATPLIQQRSNPTTRLEHQPGYMISICVAEKIGEPRVGWTIDRSLYDRIVGSMKYPG